MSDPGNNLRHSLVRMRGRDPHEAGRASTPLELLFDLTFVVAFGLAASELSHFEAENEFFVALVGFSFAAFAITWAWINYSWFASAYDTDDWMFRLLTMVQMLGAIIFGLGLHDMFSSLEQGDYLDNRVMVAGYVIMRLALAVQWLRARNADPARAKHINYYIVTLLVAQVFWVIQAVLQLSIGPAFAMAACIIAIELGGPVLAERGEGTPWHAHHIAERYGLFIIITLGEGLIGTMAALSAVQDEAGWSTELVALAIAGTAMPFGMWWIYFVMPSGEVLHRRRERSFFWGYAHIVLISSSVAVGAGLHAAAYYVDQHSKLGATATLLTVAIPLGLFLGGVFVIYSQLTRRWNGSNWAMLIVMLALLGVAVAIGDTADTVHWALLLMAATPWVTVIGYEMIGHRQRADVLAQLDQ